MPKNISLAVGARLFTILPPMEDTIRLQKFLSERGVCARRGATELLNAGRVTVNGETVREPGLRIRPEVDEVCFDGARLPANQSTAVTILLYKPRGYICSKSSAQGKTVYTLLPPHLHSLRSAGRLDKDSEGLLVLTDDGGLIQKLTHPRHGHSKTYRVSVSGDVDATALKQLRSELEIEGYRTRPAQVTVLGPGSAAGRTVLRIVLKEGRNRQIRHMCAAAGLRVHRLLREQHGPYRLAGLKPGEWREANQPPEQTIRY